jgi:predicted DNA-binding protein
MNTPIPDQESCPDPHKTKQLTLRLPEDSQRKLKILAACTGKTNNDYCKNAWNPVCVTHVFSDLRDYHFVTTFIFSTSAAMTLAKSTPSAVRSKSRTPADW